MGEERGEVVLSVGAGRKRRHKRKEERRGGKEEGCTADFDIFYYKTYARFQDIFKMTRHFHDYKTFKVMRH